MKIRILDRILVALAGLLMLAGGAALAAQLFFGKNVAGWVSSRLADDSLRVYIIIGGVLLLLLGVYCVLMLFRHKGRNGKFIMQRTESGELAISLKALESMVQKCLEQHKELSAQTVSLENQRGSLLIRIRGTVAGGISIPLTVDTLQQQIKQYVTACSGVEVKDIRVEIESSGPDATDAPFAIEAPAARGLLKGGNEPLAQEEQKSADNEEAAAPEQEKAEPAAAAETNSQTEDDLSAAAAAAAMVMDHAPEEEDNRPMHQRLFSTVEEPCIMPMPPANIEEENREESKPEAKEPAEEIKAEVNNAEATGAEGSEAKEDKAEEAREEEPKTQCPGTEETASEEAGSQEAEAEESRADEVRTEASKPARNKTNWFRNRKAKEHRAEETKEEKAVSDTTASADPAAIKEKTETTEEGGMID